MGKNRRDQFVHRSATAACSEAPRRRVPWDAITVVAAVAALLVISVLVMQRQSASADGFVDLGRGSDISFPLSEFADGRARFYNYTTARGKEVRFFVVRSSDGVTRAAFDTCDVCFKDRRGYRQAGTSMICNNCEQAFDSHSINELRGGCNPAPLDRAIVGDRLVLRAAALEQGAFYF